MRWLLLVILASACAAETFDPTTAEDAPPVTAGKADGAAVDVVDPARSYEDRVRIMRMLEEAHPYPFAGTRAAWPDQREGYILQTEWQLHSGRATRSLTSRALWGWWPNVNYALTAWQILVLQQQRGELLNVRVIGYRDAPRFAPTARAAAAILAYYDELDRARERMESSSVPEFWRPVIEARLQRLLWEAHATSLADALARNTDLLDELPQGERQFARAWGYTAIHILQAVNFPTDAARAAPLNALLLPPRMLSWSDLASVTSSGGLTETQRAAARALWLLDLFEERTHHLVARSLERFVPASSAEEAAQLVIDVLGGNLDAEGLLAALAF